MAQRANAPPVDALGISFAQNGNNQNYAQKSPDENVSMDDSPQLGFDPLNQLEDEQDDLGLGDYTVN